MTKTREVMSVDDAAFMIDAHVDAVKNYTAACIHKGEAPNLSESVSVAFLCSVVMKALCDEVPEAVAEVVDVSWMEQCTNLALYENETPFGELSDNLQQCFRKAWNGKGGIHSNISHVDSGMVGEVRLAPTWIETSIYRLHFTRKTS